MKALILMVVFLSSPAWAESLYLTDFKNNNLDGFEEKQFAGSTLYKISSINGQKALRAISENSASGLFKNQTINIKKYPYLNWRWRIENRLPKADEKSKQGDDYSARMYVVIDGGLFVWNTKAINYVWSRTSKKGESWNNAYAGEAAKMIALRSEEDETLAWQLEKRNVYADFKALFGEAFDEIDAIAVMTDSDNSHAKAEAWYGEIFFSEN